MATLENEVTNYLKGVRERSASISVLDAKAIAAFERLKGVFDARTVQCTGLRSLEDKESRFGVNVVAKSCS